MPDLLPDFVPSWLSILSAAQPFALSGLGLVIAGQLYLLHRKVKSMSSLVEDILKPFFDKLLVELEAKAKAEFEKLTAPLHDKILELEGALGLVDADKDGLPDVLESFGAKALAAVEPPAEPPAA
jgi:hypothetical protein